MHGTVGVPGHPIECSKHLIQIPAYQRPFNEKIARERAKMGFDWHLCGFLYLAYRPADQRHYVVDGRQRLGLAMMFDDVDLLPGIRFDFEGPQHEAEVFVKLQRHRKGLVTSEMQNAELEAGGEIGRTARLAKHFVEQVQCKAEVLSTIRTLVRLKTDAIERLAPFVGQLVGDAPLSKDFLEALVYLEDELGAENSLTTVHRQRLFDAGYERLRAYMPAYHAQHHLLITSGPHAGRVRYGKVASKRLKAEALKGALGLIPGIEGVSILRPVIVDGEEIGARVTPLVAA